MALIKKVRNIIDHIKNFIGIADFFSFSPAGHNCLKINAFAMLMAKDAKFALLEK